MFSNPNHRRRRRRFTKNLEVNDRNVILFGATGMVGRGVLLFKTDSVVAGNVWLRSRAIDSPGDGPGLGGDAGKLPKASEWAPYTLDLVVPEGAAYVEYGVGLQGVGGTVWMDAPRFEVP